MKHALLVLALLLDATPAGAQDMRPGLASVAVVSSEPDGRYGFDGTVVKPARLRQALVELDAQMAISHVQLKAGRAAISAAQLAEIRALASEIGARLMVEEDGRMVPDAAPPAGG